MGEQFKNIKSGLGTYVRNRFNKGVLDPINTIVDENISDIVTTIGSFVIRAIRGKFQRSISFSIGVAYSDNWMEEALYGILYKYNKIKESSRLQLSNARRDEDGSAMYYRLNPGTHNLKYRNYDILLVIQEATPSSVTGRISVQRIYTIITYDLSPEFVTDFERDMIAHRNSLLKIKADSSTVNIYQDGHESDGYTYWEKTLAINKRKLDTIYLPLEKKKLLVDSINGFFASKEYYCRHGVSHNLKILLYGPPGPQPVSTIIPTPKGLVRMGDLQVGDYVFDHNGNSTKVTGVFPQGIQDVYRVTLNDGRETRCTDGHLWKVLYRKNIDSHKTLEKVLPLIQIMNESDIQDGGYLGYKKYFIPKNGIAQFNERPLKIDPYIVGIFLVDGTFDVENNRISLITKSKSELERINKNSDAKFIPESQNSRVAFLCDDKGYVPCEKFIHISHLLDGSTIVNAFTPTDYLFNSVQNRIALLQGIFDAADVKIINNFSGIPCIQIHVNSEVLMRQITLLANSLGWSAKYQRESETPDMLIIHPRPVDMLPQLFRYKENIDRAEQAIATFNLNNQDGSVYWGEKDNDYYISRIAKENKEEVMCIRVESEDHLYLTENFIVTHNTGKDSIAKMIASEWNRNIYYVTGGKNGKFIPNAIVDNSSDVNYPLFLVSDIDKYPFLINDTEINLDSESPKDEKINNKQMFGNMINALDGVLSAEGRIIVMTTNHIDKFSPTFLRAGRIDIKLEIGPVTPEVIRQYVLDFFDGYKLPEKFKLVNENLTVADMQFDVVFLKLTRDEFIKKHIKF